jgi:hypothetical protein
MDGTSGLDGSSGSSGAPGQPGKPGAVLAQAMSVGQLFADELARGVPVEKP